MSTYYHFYIRDCKNNNFLPIYTYGRSAAVSRIADSYVGYESFVPLNENITSKMIGECNEKLEELERLADRNRDLISDISSANSSIEEMAEYIEGLYETIDEIDEEYDEFYKASMFFKFLQNTISDAEFEDDIDENEYIYLACEIGREYMPEEYAKSKEAKEN